MQMTMLLLLHQALVEHIQSLLEKMLRGLSPQVGSPEYNSFMLFCRYISACLPAAARRADINAKQLFLMRYKPQAKCMQCCCIGSALGAICICLRHAGNFEEATDDLTNLKEAEVQSIFGWLEFYDKASALAMQADA